MLSSRKRQTNGRNKHPKELEDSMNEVLADLGLLEEGMTFEDKEDIMKVVRMSKNSAQAEEEDRKTKVISSSGVMTPSQIQAAEEDISEEDKDEGVVEHDSDTTQNFIPTDVAMRVSSSLGKKTDQIQECEKMQQSTVTQESNSTFSCERETSPVPIQVDSSDNENINTCVGNQCEIEGNDLLEERACVPVNGNDIELIPLVDSEKENESSIFKLHEDDKERCIDVFSYNHEPYARTFSRSKLRRAQEKVPFYFVPRGMDVHKYTAYFKCYVDEYIKRLSRIQKTRLEHMEWGPPISMGDSSTELSGFKRRKLDGESEYSSSKRYNFRDRMSKPRVIDFASENSEEAEEESNDEDIFTPSMKKIPGIKLSSKRKIYSINDMVLPKKERKGIVSISKKLQDTEVTVSDSIENAQEPDDTPKLLVTEASNGVFSKRVTRSKLFIASRKRIRRQGLPGPPQVQSETEHIETADITSTTDLDVAADTNEEAIEPPEQHQENIVIKPAPLSVKHRKLLMSADKNTRPLRRKTELDNVLNEEDIVKTIEEPEDKIPCPICRSLFPAKNIEEHASDCNQYSPGTSAAPIELSEER